MIRFTPLAPHKESPNASDCGFVYCNFRQWEDAKARPAPNFDCCVRFHPTGEEHHIVIQVLSRWLTHGQHGNSRNFGDGARFSRSEISRPTLSESRAGRDEACLKLQYTKPHKRTKH